MKLASIIVGLILVSSLLVGSFILTSQTLRINDDTSTALIEANESITLNVTNELTDNLNILSGKIDNIKNETNKNTDLFSLFQIAPSILDVFINLASFMISIPNGIGNTITTIFPQIPNWGFTMITLMITAIVILKIGFAIRGTTEV